MSKKNRGDQTAARWYSLNMKATWPGTSRRQTSPGGRA